MAATTMLKVTEVHSRSARSRRPADAPALGLRRTRDCNILPDRRDPGMIRRVRLVTVETVDSPRASRSTNGRRSPDEKVDMRVDELKPAPGRDGSAGEFGRASVAMAARPPPGREGQKARNTSAPLGSRRPTSMKQ